ncbi:MAG TPA: hypothetical protein VGN00_12575 [Puia sp.]|jgi:hypothetical protein
MGKSGLQREMDSFLRETEDAEFSIRRVTKSAFSQALAVDGSFLNLPDHPSIREEFGRRAFGRGTKKDVPQSMALLSMLYDPAKMGSRCNCPPLACNLIHCNPHAVQNLLLFLWRSRCGILGDQAIL